MIRWIIPKTIDVGHIFKPCRLVHESIYHTYDPGRRRLFAFPSLDSTIEKHPRRSLLQTYLQVSAPLHCGGDAVPIHI